MYSSAISLFRKFFNYLTPKNTIHYSEEKNVNNYPELPAHKNSNTNNPPFDAKIDLVHSPVIQIDLNTECNQWIESVIFQFDKTDSLSTLLSRKDVGNIFYGDLLNVVQWKYKRMKILLRDGFMCQDCKTYDLKNHVHHNYYLQDKLPWDIEDEALTTLCAECHSLRHMRESIKVYRLDNGVRVLTNITSRYCYRCNGAGYLPKYIHVQDGICFSCWGNCVNRTIFNRAINDYKNDIVNSTLKPIRIEYSNFFRNISITTFSEKIYPVISNEKIVEARLKYQPNVSNPTDDDLPF